MAGQRLMRPARGVVSFSRSSEALPNHCSPLLSLLTPMGISNVSPPSSPSTTSNGHASDGDNDHLSESSSDISNPEKTSPLPRTSRLKSEILGGIVLIGIFLFFFLFHQQFPQSPQLQPERKSVIVYTSTSFHQEVASALCCTFSNLGYNVISFIPPTADAWNIKQFYGHCVHQWLLVGQENEYDLSSPELVVFTTYPLTSHGQNDQHAMKLVQNILLSGHQTKFAGVMHHANILQSHPLPSYLPADRFTALYLGEHTLNSSHPSHIKSLFFYPIPPIDILAKHLRSPSLNSVSISSSLSSHAPAVAAAAPLSVVVQGHFGGKHSWRRDPHSLLQCLQDFQQQNNITGTKVHFIGKGVLDFTKQERRSLQIRHSSDLKSAKSFYSEIAKGQFLALTQLDEEYYSFRATSSIPAAVMTGVPLILDSKILKLYPCLRDSHFHQSIAKPTFCESLFSAFQLDSSQRSEMTREMLTCRQKYQQDAEEKFLNLLRNETKTGGT
jgi:hypothetical protein